MRVDKFRFRHKFCFTDKACDLELWFSAPQCTKKNGCMGKILNPGCMADTTFYKGALTIAMHDIFRGKAQSAHICTIL